MFQVVFCPHLYSETWRTERPVPKSDWTQRDGGSICLASPGSSTQTFLHFTRRRDNLPLCKTFSLLYLTFKDRSTLLQRHQDNHFKIPKLFIYDNIFLLRCNFSLSHLANQMMSKPLKCYPRNGPNLPFDPQVIVFSFINHVLNACQTGELGISAHSALFLHNNHSLAHWCTLSLLLAALSPLFPNISYPFHGLARVQSPPLNLSWPLEFLCLCHYVNFHSMTVGVTYFALFLTDTVWYHPFVNYWN